MIAKNSGKAIVLFMSGLVLVFGLFPESLAAQMLLSAGTTTTVSSDQAACEHSVDDSNNQDKLFSKYTSGCPGDRLTMFLTTNDNPGTPNTAEASATSQRVVQFEVNTQAGAPGVSVLPVQIAVNVNWEGSLYNTSTTALTGIYSQLGAYVDVNGFLKLTEGTAGDPGSQQAEISTNHFMGAYHAGIQGCLTIPQSQISAALMAGQCILSLGKREGGSGTIYLSGLIQTGQTYDVVLELDGDLYSQHPILGGEGTGFPSLDFHDYNILGQPLGLEWSGPMTITIGTDFQSRIAGLQEQINQLTTSLDTLRFEFLHHTHAYLTGKGVGQNNTKVNTGPPVFPVAEH